MVWESNFNRLSMQKIYNRLSTLIPLNSMQREIFIRFALLFFCLMLWVKNFTYLSFPILVLAWLLDGGLKKFKRLLHEPLVQAILILCFALAAGLLWSDFSGDNRLKWMKYFVLLIYIPFFSLLNAARLQFVFVTLLTGYACVVSIGVHQWLLTGAQGITLLNISYLGFSAILGIGVVVAVYFAGASRAVLFRVLFWVIAFLLFFIQFNQSARGLLIATLITVSFLIFLQYRINVKKYLILMTSIMLVCIIFAVNSSVFQHRIAQFKQDIVQLQQGNYKTSVGYRLAIWDVGLDGISRQPLLGHGTGSPASYFESNILTYKGGVYKELPEFQDTSHFHNDWIEMGMHLGLLGLLVFAFLLWSWYRSFKISGLSIFGAALMVFVFLAGLTDTFMLYNRAPVLLLVITAMFVSWQNKMKIDANKLKSTVHTTLIV